MSGKKNSGEQSKTILEWISDHDSVLAEAIKAVNLDRALDPQNGNGVTFIFPEDQQFREELSAMADNLDKTEFSQHINSLILPDFFQRPGDFNSRPVGNSLGQEHDCPVASHAADTLVRLPLFSDMTEAEQGAVIDAALSFR